MGTWASAPGPVALATNHVALILFLSHAAALAFGFWLGKSTSVRREAQHTKEAQHHEASAESVPSGGAGAGHMDDAQCSAAAPPAGLEDSTEASSGQKGEPPSLNSTPGGSNTRRHADQQVQALSPPSSPQHHVTTTAHRLSLSCTATSADSPGKMMPPEAEALVKHSTSREDDAAGPTAARPIGKQGMKGSAAAGEGLWQSGAMMGDETGQQQQQQQQQREVLHEQQQEQQQQQQVQQEQEQQQGQLEQHWHAAEGHQEPMPHPEVHGTPPEAPPGLRTSVSGSIVRHAQLGQQRQQVTEEHRGHLSQHLCTSVSGSIIRHASAQLPAAYSAQCPYSMVPASKQSEVVVRLKLDVGQLRQLTRELVRDLVDYAASILSEQLEPIKQSMHTISSGVSQAAQSVKKIADFIDKYAAAMRLKKQQEVCTLCVKVGLVLMLGAMVSSSIARGSLPFYSPLWQYKCAASQGSSWFFPKYWTAKLLGSHPLMWYPGLAVCFLVEVGSYFLALIALAVGAYVVLPHLFRDLHRAWYFVLPFCLGAAGGYAGMNLVGLMGGAPMVWLLCWELWVGLCCVMYAKEVQSISLRTGLISVISVVLPLATGYLPFHDIALS